ncbi:MAG: Glutathionyl-hydroquinone reductase YqjG [Nitrospira sp.]|nr:Glutathionyl-hydroquinone reductase YqjG [Nitrospira sp.]
MDTAALLPLPDILSSDYQPFSGMRSVGILLFRIASVNPHLRAFKKAGPSGLSRLSGWSDLKFIQKNQKDQPTRQTNPGTLREHGRSSVSIPSPLALHYGTVVKLRSQTMTIQAQFPDEQNLDGAFIRQPDAFTRWVTANGNSGYQAASGRYHLYVSWACPWAHRTLIVRKLKKLEDVIGMTAVDPIRDERGWTFREGPGHSLDSINGFQFLSQAYKATDPNYRGRFTVPALWDTVTKRIVTNSDDDLMRMFNGEFNRFTNSRIDLYQEGIRKEIDDLNTFIYENVNDGVYRAGFATSQQAYERALLPLFDALDQLEARLARQRYLFGSQFVETDWRLFVTLVRFDAVYHGHFKCNLRRIIDYPNLFGYLKDLYQTDGIADTVNFDHIKRHYYITHDDINPTRIVPLGPAQDLTTPHGREHLQ